MKRLALPYKLETFDDSGKPRSKPASGEGWYINDRETKQKGVCIVLPTPKKGMNQCLLFQPRI